ncbi:MAG: hypothetical protein A2Z27_03425 [candidate division Zixibacteria bacterium RBG_16_50_21]|nr:MAG: hypothetical protein A2Z27_03425 [candidate division Zixibacteria bacterium RBG_16_50_21]
MKLSKRFLTIAVVFFLSVPAFCQVYEVWVARYNGLTNGDDVPKAFLVDDSGNVYVTGSTYDGMACSDFLTIKYTPEGELQWEQTYHGSGKACDASWAIDLDNAGNVYITGTSTDSLEAMDYATLKYSPFGEVLWVRRYDDFLLEPSYDEAVDLEVDNSSFIYVTGWSPGYYGDDYLTIKYDTEGDTVWVRRFPGLSGEWPTDLAVDQSGNAYITGYRRESGAAQDFFTVKYSSSGDSLWSRIYDTPGFSIDRAHAIAVDDIENVYVTGFSTGGSSRDYATLKYSPAGDTLWVKSFDGGYDDEAKALAVDKEGNVYVTGYSIKSGPGDYEIVTIKYAPNGDISWIQSQDPVDGASIGWDLVLDDESNVYVTGHGSEANSNFYIILKYAYDGSLKWVKKYDGPGVDDARNIAISKEGDLYVTGLSDGMGSRCDIVTIRYASCDESSPKAGDANGDGSYTLSDALAAFNFLFNKPGCSPLPDCWLSDRLCRGDWDGSGTISLVDVVRAVNYIFDKPYGGPYDPVTSVGCCP